MKRLFLCLVMAACGSTAPGTDGGPSDAAQDEAATDGSPTDSSSSGQDAGSDASAGDGGLQAGDTCDPTANDCAQGLLCCPEPTHMADASTAYLCEKPVNKGCPLFP